MDKQKNVQLMQGNEAVVEGAIAAGVRFFAGYPITPSTEILEQISVRLPQVGGKFIQMEDEIASISAVLGASMGGVKAMTATSGPGFALMVETIGYAIMAEIPCVVVEVQRIGPGAGMVFTSQQDTMSVRWAPPGGVETITLAPASVKECFELTIRAVNLSERFRVPVFLLSDAYLAHIREKVEVPSYDEVLTVERTKPTVPPYKFLPYEADETGVPAMPDFGSEYRSKIVAVLHDKAGKYGPSPEERTLILGRLHNKILAHIDELPMVEEYMLEDADIAIFSYGICARAAKAALKTARAEGIKVGLMRPITIWPFPKEVVSKLTSRVSDIIVAEMNSGQLLGEVKCANEGNARIHFVGQENGIVMAPQKILSLIREVG